jgi:hypothetical protein
MATKKRATKSSSSAKVAKSKVVKASPRPVRSTAKPAPKSSKTTSKRSKPLSSLVFWQRSKFLFYVVLIAAALLAITAGLMTYDETSKTKVATSTSTTGSLFLQSLQKTGPRKAGDTLSVVLYEDSGKQEVNALQAAVRYPTDKLQFVSVKSDSAFSQEAATDTANAGLIRVARSIKPGETPVKGAKPIVTLEFRVVADTTSSVEMTVENDASLLVRSTDNKNILGSDATIKFAL